MEEKPSDTVYSNYRFITRDEVAKLNLSHLVGSKVLRSYMHGFFIDTELYDKVNLIANPNSFRDEREREIRKRIEKERESRIRSTGAVTNTKLKVNKDLAGRLQERQGDQAAESVINDDRFKELFENPEFAVDEQSHEYKQLNPVRSTTQNGADRSRGLTAAEESDEERMRNGELEELEDESEESDESDENEQESEKQAKVQKEMERLRQRRKAKEEADRFMNKMSAVAQQSQSNNESFETQVKKAAPRNKNDDSRIRRHARGEAELTFVPRKKTTQKVKVQDDRPESEKGRTKQRFDGRRRASKNAFRGM